MTVTERAYRQGWSSCMEWLARVPPEGLDAECTELWCIGWDDAMGAPLGSKSDFDAMVW